jgi:hypothetical protein
VVCTLISPSPYLSSFYMCVLVLLKLGHDGAKVRFGYQLILAAASPRYRGTLPVTALVGIVASSHHIKSSAHRARKRFLTVLFCGRYVAFLLFVHYKFFKFR